MSEPRMLVSMTRDYLLLIPRDVPGWPPGNFAIPDLDRVLDEIAEYQPQRLHGALERRLVRRVASAVRDALNEEES